jgi:hypothetical protein
MRADTVNIHKRISIFKKRVPTQGIQQLNIDTQKHKLERMNEKQLVRFNIIDDAQLQAIIIISIRHPIGPNTASIGLAQINIQMKKQIARQKITKLITNRQSSFR